MLFPFGKYLLKIGIREPIVANIGDTLVYLIPTLSNNCQMVLYKKFGGIDISWHQISSDPTIFLLNFWFWKLLPMILKSLNATPGWLLYCECL